MSSIFHVIEEEFQRLNEAKAAYKAAVAKEVQGSPQIKRIGRKDYLYLAKRDGAKVRFHYAGHVDDPEIRKVLDSVKRRQEYEKVLREIKNDLKEVRRALRGRKI